MRPARRRRNAASSRSIIAGRCREIDAEQYALHGNVIGHRCEGGILAFTAGETRVGGVDDIVGHDLIVAVVNALVTKVRKQIDIQRRAGRRPDDGLDVEVCLDLVAVYPGIRPTVDQHTLRCWTGSRNFEVAQKRGQVAIFEVGVDDVRRCLTRAVVRLTGSTASHLMLDREIVALGERKRPKAAVRAAQGWPDGDIRRASRLSLERRLVAGR